VKHGVVPGIHCNSAAFAAAKVREGFKMVMLTSDSILIGRGATAELSAMKAAIA
jgi:2-keto-3-deoxy-L-rhamnonate aldolase RhmA